MDMLFFYVCVCVCVCVYICFNSSIGIRLYYSPHAYFCLNLVNLFSLSVNKEKLGSFYISHYVLL